MVRLTLVVRNDCWAALRLADDCYCVTWSLVCALAAASSLCGCSATQADASVL